MQVPPPVQMEPSSAPASPERGGQGKAGGNSGKSKGGKKGGRNQGNNRAKGNDRNKRNQDGGGKSGPANAPPTAPAVNVPGSGYGMMPYPMMPAMPGMVVPGMPGVPMMVPPAMMTQMGAVPPNFSPAQMQMVAMGAMMQQQQNAMLNQMTQMNMGMPMGMGMEADVEDQRRMQRDAIQQQVEYYFSAENLAKDLYLRQQMNQEGWVSIHVIAGFNRLRKMLTPPMAAQLGAAAGAAADIPLLVEALTAAPDLEVHPDANAMMVRRKNGWEQYILPPSVKAAADNAAAASPGKSGSPEKPAGKSGSDKPASDSPAA